MEYIALSIIELYVWMVLSNFFKEKTAISRKPLLFCSAVYTTYNIITYMHEISKPTNQ